jgi:hypothetical protein
MITLIRTNGDTILCDKTGPAVESAVIDTGNGVTLNLVTTEIDKKSKELKRLKIVIPLSEVKEFHFVNEAAK